MTTVLNIIGGPGTGKTTLATDLFCAMKKRHYEVEMVTEYAKELSARSVDIGFLEQLDLFHTQLSREATYIGTTDYLVTDSPWILPAAYGNRYQPEYKNLWEEMIRGIIHYRKQLNITDRYFFLERQHPYNPNNRYEDQHQAEAIDEIIKDMYLEVYCGGSKSVKCMEDILVEI